MLITGRCHCGNISFTLDWQPGAGENAPAEIPVRACTCAFCTKHGGVWTAHAGAALDVHIQDATRISKYAFETKTADFYVCAVCGVVPVATSDIEGATYAVVNVNTFENVDPALLRKSSATFDGEATDARLARRKKNWIGRVRING
jgi:hypothetical protein